MSLAAADHDKPNASAQLGKYLRRVGPAHDYGAGIGHWCPGCRVMHVFTDDAADLKGKRWNWTDLGGVTVSVERNIVWHGFGRLVAAGRCHYAIRDGMIEFFADCTHALAGRRVKLPELPGHLRD